MRFNVLLAIACLAIGASAGWFLKPDPSSDSEEKIASGGATKDPISKRTNRPGISDRQISKRDKVESTSSRGATIMKFGDSSEDMGKVQEQVASMFKKRQMDQLNDRITELVAKLSLTPDQEKALREAAEKGLGDFDGIFNGEADLTEIGKLMNNDGLEESLADLLTPEQSEQYEALKERELANRVEARALNDLARLSSLDLSQDQKDAAYEILYQQAQTAIESEGPANGMLSMVTNGFGIEVDSSSLGFASAVVVGGDDSSADSGEPVDPQAAMQRAREQMEQRVNEQVEALRPVLNETQLEQYRRDLQRRQGGFFLGEETIEGIEVEVE
jgi:hypothetical protein